MNLKLVLWLLLALLVAVASVNADNKHKKGKSDDHKKDGHKKDDHKEADHKEADHKEADHKDDHKKDDHKKDAKDHKAWKNEKEADDSYKNALRGQQPPGPGFRNVTIIVQA